MANVTLRNVRKTYAGGFEAIKGIDFERRRRPVLRAGRPVRLRQVHAAAHGRGAGDHHRRRDRYRRARRQPDRAGRPRHRDGVPELRALPAYERLQQHGLRPAQPRHGRSRRSRRASRKPRAFSNSARCSSASRGNCPAASASAWRWAAPSCGSQKCSCSTSRCRTSTPSCASPCASKSANCSAGSPRPRSTSPTTSSRR